MANTFTGEESDSYSSYRTRDRYKKMAEGYLKEPAEKVEKKRQNGVAILEMLEDIENRRSFRQIKGNELV